MKAQLRMGRPRRPVPVEHSEISAAAAELQRLAVTASGQGFSVPALAGAASGRVVLSHAHFDVAKQR